MTKFKTYQFTIKIRTNQLPKDAIWFLSQKLKDVLPVISIDYQELEDRPTDVEHHGGYQDAAND